MDLPRNLFKSPGSIIFNATKTYDTILVENMKEYKEGLEAGYTDSFSDALNNEITGAFEVVDEEAEAKKAASLAKRRATIARKKEEEEPSEEEPFDFDKDDF